MYSSVRVISDFTSTQSKKYSSSSEACILIFAWPLYKVTNVNGLWTQSVLDVCVCSFVVTLSSEFLPHTEISLAPTRPFQKPLCGRRTFSVSATVALPVGYYCYLRAYTSVLKLPHCRPAFTVWRTCSAAWWYIFCLIITKNSLACIIPVMTNQPNSFNLPTFEQLLQQQQQLFRRLVYRDKMKEVTSPVCWGNYMKKPTYVNTLPL
jgi:hypothetical protein